MGEGCDDSICVDKPSVSKLSQKNGSTLFKQTEMERIYPERPLYRTEFGRATWKVLHRISAKYPDTPSENEKRLINQLFKGISLFFPCKECADHFKEEIRQVPPKVENNKDLSKWLCYQHNQVNKRLGKEITDCNNINKIISEFKL